MQFAVPDQDAHRKVAMHVGLLSSLCLHFEFFGADLTLPAE